MRKSRAFTLAEVLITLVIIGVIAAMTIPTLMGSTNRQEIKSKLKKVISEANQALALEYALYGKEPFKYGQPVSQDELYEMLTNHLSVVEEFDDNMFKTADGIYFHVWPDGVGAFNVSVNNWKGGDSALCNSVEECENANLTYFHFDLWCNPGTGHKICPSTASTYAYVYDISIQDAFDKFGGNWR